MTFNTKFSRTIMGCVALLGLSVGHTAHAATVTSSCTVATTPVNFGIYWGNVPLASTGSVTVTCTPTTPVVQVSLNKGTGGTSIANRMMRGGTQKISYNLYIDSAQTSVWGDGTGGSVIQTGTQLTIFGVIPAAQVVTPGTYSDTVTVTIVW